MSPTVLITGASSGIGRATAALFAAKGWRVFGTTRGSGALPGIETLRLDVTDQASVDAALAALRGERLDVLVNNAGAMLRGAIEESSIEQARALFEVNVFGVMRLCRGVLPGMRGQGGGRIIILGSIAGFLPMPFEGLYAASKHALEGYAETLDHEVRGFGVRVTLVQPGYVRTGLDDNQPDGDQPLAAYDGLRDGPVAAVANGVRTGDDPAVVAAAILRAATMPHPPRRLRPGRQAKLLHLLRSLTPPSLFDRALRRSFGMAAGPSASV